MGIGKWFRERWVDISRPKKGGGYEACGRSEAKKGAYPKCVPAEKASSMTSSQKRSAVSRKRAAIKKAKSLKSPTRVATFSKLARAKKAR